MDVLAKYLEARESQNREEAQADERWMRERGGVDPAERLVRWDRWLRRHLRKTLRWPEDETKREKLIGQCAAEITGLVKQLRGRGWLLDGDALAAHVTALLEPVGKAQRDGKVRRFWPYFRHAVRVYVGANAEEIQLHARRTGTDESTVSLGAAISGLVAGLEHQRGSSLTELISERAAEVSQAKTLQERTRAARRQDRCKADARQRQLF